MRSLILIFAISGCASVIEPGHRGLLFDPRSGGLQHPILAPGRHYTGISGRIEDFDVTFSTRKEQIQTTSSEGLAMKMHLAVIYRPIISEIYELDTEIGPNYYDEVIGPEFRSAARGVFARHSYLELQRNNESIENQIEDDLRRRTAGKHVDVSSVTIEAIDYAPEIAQAVQAKLVGEQEALRQKAALENDSLRRKLELEHQAEQDKLKAEAALRAKTQELAMAEKQAAIDRIEAETAAETRVTKAKAESQELTLLAKAHAEEQKATSLALTPLSVMVHAYDALARLGGNGTTIMLGDWAHVPNFLFPQYGAFRTVADVAGVKTKP